MTRASNKLVAILLMLSSVAGHAQVSYWWSQLQRKPDAKQSQEFWFVPGQGIFFTYETNHVIINSGATSGFAATNLTVLFPGTNITFTTNALGLTINSGGGGATVGLTTNFPVIFGNLTTNTLFFTNGLLMAINSIPAHGSSIILPGGGYLTQPGGSTLLLP
jgi:hypothetical protein